MLKYRGTKLSFLSSSHYYFNVVVVVVFVVVVVDCHHHFVITIKFIFIVFKEIVS